jgi:hypothetical protein
MRPPSEYIAPFDEDRQTGLVQAVPAGGAVADWDVEAVADWLAELDAEAVADWLAELDAEAVADWLAELDDEADAEVEAVAGADVGGDFVAEADALLVPPGGVVTPPLLTVNVARRMDFARYDHFRTAVIVCGPSVSFAVSKGRAVPSLAVPPRSKGCTTSVRTGFLDRHESSR